MKRKKIILGIVSIIMVLICLTGCNGMSENQNANNSTHTVVDMSGIEVTVPDNIERYAVLWAGVTDIVALYDGVEHMVCYPETSASYPFYEQCYPQIKDIPTISKEDASFEAVLNTNAQVVFLKSADNENLAEQLRDAGVPVIDCEFNNYEELKEVVTLIGETFGSEEDIEISKKYNSYVDDVIEYVTKISATISEENKESVLVIRDTNSYSAYGLTRYTGQWVEMCGGRYAMINDDPYANVNLTAEQLMEYNPDHIFFVIPSEAEKFKSDNQWAALKAVQLEQVYSNPCGINAWSNCGAESVLQCKWAFSILYPELVDYDETEEIRNFYQEFYGYVLTDNEVENILNP